MKPLFGITSVLLTTLFSSVDLLLIPSSAAAQSGTIITLDPSTTYQTIVGWDSGVQSGHTFPEFPLYKDELFDLAVNDLGLTRMNVEIRAGAENTAPYYGTGGFDKTLWYNPVNDNNDPDSVDL